MKILFGLPISDLPGGVNVTERAFVAECRKLTGVSLATFDFGSRSVQEGILARLTRTLLDVRAFGKLLRRERPQIVHINSSYDKRALLRDVLYARVSRRNGVPLFIKFHGSDEALLKGGSSFWRFLTRRLMRDASGFGVISAEERENFLRAGYPGVKFHVVRNVVDSAPFDAPSLPKKVPPQLLFAGRFIPAKGLVETIRAVHLVRLAGKDVRLACVGDGEQRREAEQMVRETEMQNVVHFTGHIPEEEAVRYYQESTALLFPTYHQEGFSMVIFQSVAAGLPVITTRIRAAADYLREPDNCLWVKPKDPDDLAQKISYLMERPDMLEAIARNNRQLGKRFAAAVLVPEYVQVYQDVIAEHRATSRT